MQDLTAEQLAVVEAWAKQHGRTWKADLRAAWANGNYNGFQGSSLLQQLRNTFGPSWLTAFRLPFDVPAPIATGIPVVCELWPAVDRARIAWMESILANDESSTDYELGLFFIAHAVPSVVAEAYIAHRTDYLNSL
jgi:hypothetical protein